MKTILCYGDSLTFGSDPTSDKRHAFQDRWPTELGRLLGEDNVRIIAEGLGGRTTVFDDYSNAADKNGATLLPTILASHSPLDCVVVMLGTNDMKTYINGTAIGAAMGMRRLVEIVQTFAYKTDQPIPKIVLVAPPHCVETDHAYLDDMFKNGISESKKLAPFYAQIASEDGCAFFDAQSVASAHPADGVHLDAQNTRAIGAGLAPIVAKVLNIANDA